MLGSYAIVGAHLPIALGAAWSAQYRKSGQVAVCFFGDGTTNIGAFHEALNLAVVWKAAGRLRVREQPVHGVHADRRGDRRRRGRPPTGRSAYGLEPIVVDGNDADAVLRGRAPTRSTRARAGDGPSLIEALTYRHGGHSRADPGKYRPDDEVAAWMARDPIPRAARRCSPTAGVEAGRLDAIDEAARGRGRAPAEAGGARAATRSPSLAGRGRLAMTQRRGPTAARRRRRSDRRAMTELTYRAAIAAGIAQEMERDERSSSSARTSARPAACSS